MAIPYALASAITPGRGERAHFSFQGTLGPRGLPARLRPAARGGARRTTCRSVPMDDSIGCTQRGNTLPRGSNSVLDRDPEARHRR